MNNDDPGAGALIITTANYDFEVSASAPAWSIIGRSDDSPNPIAVVTACGYVNIQSTNPGKLLALGQALITAAEELAHAQPVDTTTPHERGDHTACDRNCTSTL